MSLSCPVEQPVLPLSRSGCSLEMPKDELPNHNCVRHLRSVVQQQQTRIAELEKASAEHKHQLAEQVGPEHEGDASSSVNNLLSIPDTTVNTTACVLCMQFSRESLDLSVVTSLHPVQPFSRLTCGVPSS